MAEDPEMDALCAEAVDAIGIMYSGDSVEATRASKWVDDLSNSESAWEVGHTLFVSDVDSVEVKFLSLGMMQTYATVALGTADEATHSSIKETVLEVLLTAVAAGDRMVVNKACVLLSAVAIRTVPDAWDSVIGEVFEAHLAATETLGEDLAKIGALTFCRVFVQEVAKTPLPPKVLPLFMDEYSNNAASILEACGEELSNPNPDRVKAALECLEAWLHIRGGPVKIDMLLDHISPILELVMQPEVGEAAADMLVAIVRHPSSDENPTLIRELAPAANAFAPLYAKAVEEGDPDTATELVRFPVMLGDNHIQTLLHAANEAEAEATREFVGFMMQILGHPAQYPIEETVSKSTLYFWDLYIMSVHDPETDDLLDLYKQLYFDMFEPLLMTIVGKLRRVADESDLTIEDIQDFNEYRSELRDHIASILEILGAKGQGLLVEALEEAIAADSQGADDGWRAIEAALQALHGSAQSLRLEEDEFTPRFFECLEHLPNHPHVLTAALHTLAEYSEWINVHPEHLEQVVALLLQAIEIKEFVEPTLHALQQVSQHCAEHLEDEAFEAMLGPCLGLFEEVLTRANRKKLVETMCSIIGAGTHERALVESEKLCASALSVVVTATDNDSSRRPDEAALDAALRELDLVCRRLELKNPVPELEHPVLALTKALWPSFEILLGSPRDLGLDDDVVSTAWALMRSAIMTLDELSSAFMDPLVGSGPDDLGLLAVSFYECPTKGVLECFLLLVTTFHKWEEAREGLASMMTHLTEMFANGFDTFKEDPDITVTFFALVWKGVQIAPAVAFFNDKLAPLMVHLGTEGLKLPEHVSIKKAVLALQAILGKARTVEAAEAAMVECGPALLGVVYEGIGGAIDRSVALNEVSKLIEDLYRYLRPQLVAWTEDLFSQNDFPTAMCDEGAKGVLLRQLKLDLRQRDLNKALDRFANACRGF